MRRRGCRWPVSGWKPLVSMSERMGCKGSRIQISALRPIKRAFQESSVAKDVANPQKLPCPGSHKAPPGPCLASSRNASPSPARAFEISSADATPVITSGPPSSGARITAPVERRPDGSRAPSFPSLRCLYHRRISRSRRRRMAERLQGTDEFQPSVFTHEVGGVTTRAERGKQR